MRVTIRDIARECGCSTAAVSLALGDKKGRVSPDMARRIRETAARLQYTPNRAAVSLATASTAMPAEDFVTRFGPRLVDAARTLSKAMQASGGIVGGP